MPVLYMDSGNLTQGPHVCVVGTFPTESSPQHSTAFFAQYYYRHFLLNIVLMTTYYSTVCCFFTTFLHLYIFYNWDQTIKCILATFLVLYISFPFPIVNPLYKQRSIYSRAGKTFTGRGPQRSLY